MNYMKTGNKNYPYDSNLITRPVQYQEMGRYRVITLINETANHGIQFIPELGGRINKLWLHGHQVIEGYRTAEEIENDTFYHNVYLFPFVNRLEDGRYHFNGTDYQFPINEPGTHNALHGFLYNETMEVLEQEITGCKSLVHLQYKYNGERPYYPFHFKLDLWYHLKDNNNFELEFSISNTGETEAPMGWGWHPYFTFQRPADEIKLHLPSDKQVAVDKRMLPNGSFKFVDRYLNGKIIAGDKLDNSFRLNVNEKRNISLISEADHTKIEIIPDNTFPYAHVFIPPKRQSIAVEPITSGINAYNTGDGLIRIQPGASYSGNIQVTVTNI